MKHPGRLWLAAGILAIAVAGIVLASVHRVSSAHELSHTRLLTSAAYDAVRVAAIAALVLGAGVAVTAFISSPAASIAAASLSSVAALAALGALVVPLLLVLGGSFQTHVRIAAAAAAASTLPKPATAPSTPETSSTATTPAVTQATQQDTQTSQSTQAAQGNSQGPQGGGTTPVLFQGAFVPAHVRPTSLQLSADGTLAVTAASWSSWGETSATGTGVASFHGCDPNCAQATPHTAPVTISLQTIKTCDGREYYSRAVVRTESDDQLLDPDSASWAPC
jgi:hypothetical protein